MTATRGEVIQRLQGLETRDLVEMVQALDALDAHVRAAGPKTDDELHEYVLVNYRVDIPRTKVCPDHVPPFKLLADCYFERTNSALAMANRGGSKTFIMALLHCLNAEFKPGVEMATVGAIEAQARRAYAHVQKLITIRAGVQSVADAKEIGESFRIRTAWKNGSVLEVLGGTKNAVNGPHPQKVHFDEAELADPEVYDESRNMSQSKDGIMAQDFVTSTRKGLHGMMQKLLDQCAEAERTGMVPPFQVYAWCIWESAARVDNCRVANPDCDNPCNCNKVLKGKWDDGKPRTFDTVCRGRLSESAGWIPIHDVHKTFLQDSHAMWDAQQECTKPDMEGLVFPSFSREINGVKGFVPDPDNGMIFTSTDFGGTNPHAVGWYQLLDYEIDATPYIGKGTKRLKEGTLVLFDELYIAEISNSELGRRILEREAKWKRQVKRFRVKARFADPQGKAARMDLMDVDSSLRTVFRATRDIKEHLKKCKELFEDDLFVVDVPRCLNFSNEVEAYHYPKKRATLLDDPEIPVNDFDHMMASFRYCVANVYQIQKRRGRGPTPLPASSKRRYETATGGSPGIPVSRIPGRSFVGSLRHQP